MKKIMATGKQAVNDSRAINLEIKALHWRPGKGEQQSADLGSQLHASKNQITVLAGIAMDYSHTIVVTGESDQEQPEKKVATSKTGSRPTDGDIGEQTPLGACGKAPQPEHRDLPASWRTSGFVCALNNAPSIQLAAAAKVIVKIGMENEDATLDPKQCRKEIDRYDRPNRSDERVGHEQLGNIGSFQTQYAQCQYS